MSEAGTGDGGGDPEAHRGPQPHGESQPYRGPQPYRARQPYRAPQPYGTTEGQPPPATYPFAAPPQRSLGRPEPSRAAEPPTRATTGEGTAHARRLGRLAVYNAVVGIVCSLVFFPVGLVLDIAAIVLGIRARRAAVAAGYGEGAGVLAVVLGAVGLSMALVLTALVAVFWTQISSYRDCASGANTHAASADCEQALRDGLLRRLGADPITR